MKVVELMEILSKAEMISEIAVRQPQENEMPKEYELLGVRRTVDNSQTIFLVGEC